MSRRSRDRPTARRCSCAAARGPLWSMPTLVDWRPCHSCRATVQRCGSRPRRRARAARRVVVVLTPAAGSLGSVAARVGSQWQVAAAAGSRAPAVVPGAVRWTAAIAGAGPLGAMVAQPASTAAAWREGWGVAVAAQPRVVGLLPACRLWVCFSARAPRRVSSDRLAAKDGPAPDSGQAALPRPARLLGDHCRQLPAGAPGYRGRYCPVPGRPPIRCRPAAASTAARSTASCRGVRRRDVNCWQAPRRRARD